MSRARVSWIEISLGEFIAFSAAAGTALAVGHASGRTVITSRDRLTPVVATARGAMAQASPRGQIYEAEDRLEWAP